MPNRLQNSPSAYLQQHANNPVDWWPWSSEAWETAAANGQWVLISIGYSTCHWCHAMERDVFEKQEAADAMNDWICIKVDREERPDVDQTYMQAALAMNGQGGWPLNVVALPDGRPVWAGTYLPLDRWLALIRQLKTIQSEQPSAADDYAHQLITALQAATTPSAPASSPSDAALPSPEDLWDRVAKGWDSDRKGHRRAQPFPLSDEWLQTALAGRYLDWPAATHHAAESLYDWYTSGSYDVLDGGLMRYATEPSKRIPHFEKMLYDNALYALACLSTSAVIRHPNAYYTEWGQKRGPELMQAAQTTLTFLENHLLQPNGLYGAGWDADSDGEEGRYYTWTEEELTRILGPDEAITLLNRLKNAGGIPWEGRWILHRAELSELEKNRLLEARRLRNPPFRDPKSLLSWNAWAVRAWVAAARWGNTPDEARRRALELGRTAASQFFPSSETPHKQSLHRAPAEAPRRVRFPEGLGATQAQLEDVAVAVHAFLDLASIDDGAPWLKHAHEWLLRAENDYPHRAQGTSSTPRHQADRPFLEAVEIEDSVLPSANALLTEALIRWGLVTGDSSRLTDGLQRMEAQKMTVSQHPASHTHWLSIWTSLETSTSVRGAWTFGGRDAARWRLQADSLFVLSPDDTVVLEPSDAPTWVVRCTPNSCSAPYTAWEDFLAAASLR